MRRLALLWSLLLLLLAALPAAAAPLTGAQILQRALDLQQGLRDYTATIVVTVDMPGVKVPQRTAKLYFKRPDKVHIESKGVVMVPRRALLLNEIGRELARNSTVALAGQTVRDGAPYYFLKATPRDPQGREGRMLLWVRGDRFTVERAEIYVARDRVLAVDWQWQRVGRQYWAPRRLTAVTPGRQLPRRHGPPEPAESRAKVGPGTVTVEFRDLRVNTGLPDSLFVEPKS